MRLPRGAFGEPLRLHAAHAQGLDRRVLERRLRRAVAAFLRPWRLIEAAEARRRLPPIDHPERLAMGGAIRPAGRR